MMPANEAMKRSAPSLVPSTILRNGTHDTGRGTSGATPVRELSLSPSASRPSSGFSAVSRTPGFFWPSAVSWPKRATNAGVAKGGRNPLSRNPRRRRPARRLSSNACPIAGVPSFRARQRFGESAVLPLITAGLPGLTADWA